MSAKCFIIGTGRCGTEMLVNILNCHPSLLVFNEIMFLLPCLQRYGDRQVAAREMIDHALRVSHVGGESALWSALDYAGVSRARGEDILDSVVKNSATLSAFDLLEAIGTAVARILGKEYWAEKCPDAGYFSRQIHGKWPNTAFIHVVRDGYAVARSMQKHHGFMSNVICGSDTWASLSTLERSRVRWNFEDAFPLSAYLDLWGRRYLYIEEQLKKISDSAKILRISYEKILEDPSSAIAEIYAFLGIDRSAEAVAKAAELIDTAKLAPRPWYETEEAIYRQVPSARAARILFDDQREAEDPPRAEEMRMTRAVRLVARLGRCDNEGARALIEDWAHAKSVSVGEMVRMLLAVEPEFSLL